MKEKSNQWEEGWYEGEKARKAGVPLLWHDVESTGILSPADVQEMLLKHPELGEWGKGYLEGYEASWYCWPCMSFSCSEFCLLCGCSQEQ